MPRFTTLSSPAVPLPAENIDTDQIIPAHYLKVTDRSGLGDGLFAHWRRDEAGSPRPEFVLNQPQYQGAQILLAGENFGCGSSREHAPWSLLEYGFRVVISTRFADIFRNNALKNGLLVITVSPPVYQNLMQAVVSDPATDVTIDLPAQQIGLPDGSSVAFDIPPFARHCLLNDIDQLGYLRDQLPAIEEFESRHPPGVSTHAPSAPNAPRAPNA
jgi:3-isopropylmalate/(R)-2-methylmalate dehydratase small subunit